MKRLLFLSLVALLPTALWASTEVNGIYYNLLDNNTAEVTYMSTTARNQYSGDIVVPATFEYGGQTYTVVGLGDQAFYNGYNITSLILPETITYIGYRAFYHFSYKSSSKLENPITSLELPTAVTMIGNEAFYQCDLLEEITLPVALTSIGYRAFYNCSALTSLGKAEAPLPETVTFVAHEAFRGTAVKYINIPSSFTEIPQSMFYGAAIESIDIPDAVTYIGGRAFMDCTNLKAVVLNDYVILGDSCFYDCSAFTEFNFPANITEIPQCALYGCSHLTTIDVPAGVTTIGNYAFFKDSLVTTLTLPASLQTVGTGCCRQMVSLKSVVLPAALEELSSDMFYQDAALAQVTFADGTMCKAIGGEAFMKTALTDITIPATVESFGKSVFRDVTTLKNVYLLNPMPAELIDNTIFYDDDAPTVYVPAGTIDAYRETQWGNMESTDGVSDDYHKATYCEADYTVLKIEQSDGSDGYDTYYNRDYDVTLPSGVVAYTVVGVDNGEVTLNKIDNGIVPTGTAVLLKGAVGIYLDVAVTSTVATASDGNMLYGNATTTTTFGGDDDENYYYYELSEQDTRFGFFWHNSDGSAFNKTANKAWLAVPQNAVSSSTNALFFTAQQVEYFSCASDDGTLYAYHITSFENHTCEVSIGEYAGALVIPASAVNSDDAETYTVEGIGEGAFADCAEVTTVILPAFITSVGAYAFQNAGVQSIEADGATPASCGTDAFDGITTTCILYIPVGTYDAYAAAAEWQKFESIIEMTEFAIETLEATDVTDSSATLNGSVTEAYNDPITEKGFEYWTGNEEALKAVVEGDEMTASVTNLTQNTTYYYRAYAVMESGTTEYGEELTFTTEDVPTGINGIRISIDDENVEGIYSTSGQKLNTTVKGVNIIRYNDGSVKKLYVK